MYIDKCAYCSFYKTRQSAHLLLLNKIALLVKTNALYDRYAIMLLFDYYKPTSKIKIIHYVNNNRPCYSIICRVSSLSPPTANITREKQNLIKKFLILHIYKTIKYWCIFYTIMNTCVSHLS